MCKEFLWLSKIKPIASHQAERIHVYIWPTLFGRTIINLWYYNLKHNEGKLLRKIPLLMNEVRHQGHCSALHHPLQHLDSKSLSVPVATVPCRDRALYFHTGRWISRRWTKPGTLPRISGSQQAIWFTCWSAVPWANLVSTASTLIQGTCAIYNHHHESTDHFIKHGTCMHSSLEAYFCEMEYSKSCFLVLLSNNEEGTAMLRVFSRKIYYYSGSC